ncbi:hypothetical protein PTSG_01785 [Salpingoeca rosetta]|uniref:U3 small nucleolar RNA-associated protein 15 C-terminal domain-containing protein n=1 Tax=Salpingoeca rosetta (strain ATCC 50818 / BSB-021) TaxID=946362 RepID=F2TYY6_SALR5|nr:uncharacterized protein PTSG_01785 [Salpingoeca rosetta]EGD78810.1 hypothetical protein PTSG_01785 [Salpingoeca rosetta]|eukprot:XP_004997766.1 hypothetical protein PTSG_01785 [Salpingoeca rosetta]
MSATAIQQFPRLAEHATAEDRHWKKYGEPRMVKEVGPVQAINFCAQAPHDYVVTAGSHVHVYSGQTHRSKITFSKFTAARSGAFRRDGKLLVAGDKAGPVKIFNINTKSPLRIFEGHRKDVRVTNFLADTQVFSAGEEGVVKLWDIPQEQEALSIQLSNDYITSGNTIEANPSLVFLGGYDHKARLVDVRSGESQLEVDHGASIECVWAFNNGTMVITAGQNHISIWDVLAGGKLVDKLSNHRQTITGVCLDHTEKRLFSCGLDRMVKVYDVTNWSVVHSMKFTGQLLSMGIAPDDSALAVGHSNGYLGVRVRRPKGVGGAVAADGTKKKRRQPRPGTRRYFMRGQSAKPSRSDMQVQVKHKRKSHPHNRLLAKFRFSEALDEVFRKKFPSVVKVSFMHELMQREALRTALSNRDEAGLEPILSFVVAQITNPRYTRILTHVAHLILDIYSPGKGRAPRIDSMFVQLSNKLKQELNLQRQLIAVQGMLDALLDVNPTD